MVSTLVDRPMLTPEERDAILARLHAREAERERWFDEVEARLGIDREYEDLDAEGEIHLPAAAWHNLAHEEPDADPLPVNAAGMAAMVKFFALLEE